MQKLLKWSSVGVIVLVCVVALSASARPQNPDPDRESDRELSDADAAGKAILEHACLACHPIGMIEDHHLDATGWTNIVDTMISMGADVIPSERGVLVDYLAKFYGPE